MAVQKIAQFREQIPAHVQQVTQGNKKAAAAMTAQAMHLAASLPHLSFACEFGEFVRLENDITQGVENINGFVSLSDQSGSGASLRADAAAHIAAAEKILATS
jgi:hypothetical protein